MKCQGGYPLFKRLVPLFILLVFAFPVPAESQVQPYIHKLSPLLASQMGMQPQNSRVLYRVMIAENSLPKELNSVDLNAKLIIQYERSAFYLVTATEVELVQHILPLTSVLFVDAGNRIPKEEVLTPGFDLSANRINIVHRLFPQWNGDGLTVSVKENKPDTTDIDLAGRYLSTSLSSSVVSSHATTMASMIAGGGNTWYIGKGAATAAIVSSSNYSNLLPDPSATLQSYNITVQNHSYGVGIENFYGADAAAYDASLISNPTLLNIFSSGNSGTQAGTTGTYSGIAGFANLTGSFKMAKNIITVGAADSFGNVVIPSSKGPAYDGRIKPELTAFGIDGSSGASALVSGVSLMLQQQYRQLNGSLPANALVKAVILNSADDKGNKEPDYSNGFGCLNALNAVRTIQWGRYNSGSATNGSAQNFSLSVPAGIKKLKITLAWNDPPAAANATKALVNDLDLELMNTGNGNTWKPWVLNKFPHLDSLKQFATRKKDSLNNVEQVTLDDPLPGNYQVSVKGYSVSTTSQAYYFAYQFDSTDIFEWHYPTTNDPVFSASVNTIRWNSSYPAATGRLEYSIDNGANWLLIDPALDLSKGYYTWNAPALNSVALLKMTIGTISITSDAFVISSLTQTGVGFNCPDSFLYYWHKTPPLNTYRLYRLGNKYLEPILLTTDSFTVLQKNTSPSLYYAVAPVIAGKEGLKSYATNYTIQGVDCYIRFFIANLVNNTAVLSLSLGSLYQVNKIVLEKFDGKNFNPIQERTNNTSQLIYFTDLNLTRGLNIYRVRIELAGGGIVYSTEEYVFFFKGSNYVIYPNPASQNSDINIAVKNIELDKMRVINTAGVKVYEMTLDDQINKIPARKLSKGIYFIHILNKAGAGEMFKLIVQ